MWIPLHYLDFETFAPAIPRFIVARPYEAIRLLFSVHIGRDEQPIEYNDSLHESDDGPQPQIAECLVDVLVHEDSISTFFSDERRVLRILIDALPEHAAPLAEIKPQLCNSRLTAVSSRLAPWSGNWCTPGERHEPQSADTATAQPKPNWWAGTRTHRPTAR